VNQPPTRTLPPDPTGGLRPVTQATIDFAPKETSRLAPRGLQVRLVQVAGSASLSTDELRDLLRNRLQLIVLFGLALSVVGLAMGLAFDSDKFSDLNTLFTQPPLYGPGIIWVGFNLILLAVLARWRWIPLSGCRALEWAVFAPAVLLVTWNEGLDLIEYLPDIRVGRSRLTCSSCAALTFVVRMVIYAVFIPNTWRRCAAATALIACPIVVTQSCVLLAANVPLQHAGLYLFNLSYWLVVAMVIVAYGAHRIEASRKQAADARKLGQYRLTEQLGAGGMGEVYRAEHALLRRPCAIKLIRPDRALDPAALARFEREVQTSAALAHPHVVRIHDYGRADDGTFYCVMEFLPGATLDDLVKRHGPLPPARAVFLLRQLCSALAEAHAAGLTHRDVKPGNVIVRDAGRQADFATLLDFGLVLDRSAGDDKLTREGAVAGTPAYMAPEQAAGDRVDHRADVYAVGAVGYFLLSGRAPFAGGSAMRTIAAVLSDAPKPLDGAPPELTRVLMRCLAKAPGERFASADELDAALAGCAGDGWSHEQAAAWWAGRTGSAPETDGDTTRTLAARPDIGGAPR
jgi:serine/threonine-protein kinase